MSSFSSSCGDQESKSGANPGPDWILDNRVFLSFRGKDSLIVSFTSDLYHSLQNAGASVISIDEELRSIDQISTSSLQEIQRSRGSVIVFSKDYADSRYCLEELEKIMECRRTTGQVVVPVFYGVDASEVRHQTGKFGEAFEDLIKRKSMEKDKVLSWREALHEAGGISGFVVTDSRHESEAIKNVVDHVIDHLLHSTNLFVAEHPVGLQIPMQDFISMLDYQESTDVKLVGIWGMTGIGKTTIAKAFYNQISRNFEGRKFLPNISEVWEKDTSQVPLQERLLSSICKTTKIKIDGIESGKIILKERLRHKRVFLVLDDVNELEQLNALCEIRDWFGAGSIIIITTRDQYLMDCAVDILFEVTELNDADSLELLSWYAFNQAFPKRDFTELSTKVARYSQGLPLVLEVFGSHPLFGKGITEWQRALDRLKIIPDRVAHEALRVWFDHLDDTEKRIFLDIACFFTGLDRNDVIQALNGSGHSAETGISILEEQGFVKVDEENKLVMHVLLQDLGKNIIREESRNERGAKIFDVFLSFRGEDTRASLTSYLCNSLQNAGIYVFKDDDAIQRGDQITISLLQAIGKSRIAVIVLSRNYANSRWCLQELENIMESRRTTGLVVVPVFYGVNPSEVRHQTGMFGQAFEDMLKGILVENDKVQSWRKALHEVGGVAGFVVIKSRNESEDIMKVVENVTHLLDRTDLFVAQHPVGVKSRVQDVIKILNNQQSNDPLLLGIWGMGGIGKTTIAKAIYNEIGRKFEGRSFLLNVREVWEQDNGQVHLQEQLLSDVYKTTKIKIHSIESGKLILKERLRQKKVLIVLDDVDNLEQLNALSGSHEWFRPGSVIIITTRDEHLLSVLRVDDVYKMEEMDESESVELFSWHAFKQANPKEEFAGLSGKVIAYSGRLPLALEVLGSYLFERETREWESVLKKLESIPNNQVQKKLKISFDGLSDDKEREIFLDIAFFFIGLDRNDVIHILNDCGHFTEIGISVLVERSLVTVDSKNKLRMHDLLRDMGREVIREKSSEEPEERSRLWHPDDVLDVLSKHTGTKAIKGLALKLPRMNPICHLNTEAFKEMNRLRLLQLVGVQLDGDFKYLSRDLRWLCWHGFPSTYTPANFDQRSLVAINLKYSNLRLVWKKGQFLEKLKILNLSHSHDLTQTPDFSKLPNLEKLILKDCPKLSEVSHNIGHLNKLLLINLKDCTSLCNLPRSIYKLKSLKTLILSGCLMIDKLEEDLQQMESLTSLIANNTAITQVPFAVVRLKNIGYISLCGYEGLSREVFPSLIWSWNSPTNILSSLVQTSASMSSSDFSDLPKVQSLLVECSSELQLTGDVARIWDTLNATYCKELEATPTTSQVSNMKTSSLIECRSQDDISGSKNSLNSLLIKMGMNCQIANILEESFLQKMNTCESGDCLLPGDQNPDWLTFNGEGSSVNFEVPRVKGRNLKTMTLCVVYSSSPDIITSEGLKNVLIVNYTKTTTQVYDRDTLISFKDEEWQSVISNLEPSNKVQVVVVFGNGFIVKKTAVYLIYDEPFDEKMEDCHATDKNVIVSGDNDMAAEDKNLAVSGGDDRVAHENVVISGGNDMAADKNVSVSGSDDTTVDKNVIVYGGDDMPADKNVDIVSGGDENRFRRLFTLPSLVRAVLISRPFWFGLAVIFVCTCLRFDKRRSGNLVLRYTLRWKWLMGCIKKLIAYKKGNRAQIAIKSSSTV